MNGRADGGSGGVDGHGTHAMDGPETWEALPLLCEPGREDGEPADQSPTSARLRAHARSAKNKCPPQG